MNDELRIIFAGTPEIAKNILENVLKHYKVSLLLTQPDRPKGRGKKIQPNPIKTLANLYKIDILQPNSFKENQKDLDIIANYKPDIIIVIAYGLIFPQEILNLAKIGCINIHVSLLPKYRGASPIQRAIINGETKTGVTIMKMDEGLDTGDILLQKEISIENTDTTGTLTNKLATLSSELILDYLSSYKNIKPIRQPEENISYANKINKSETLINWNENAKTIWRKIRAFNPAPGCYSYLNNKLIKIWSAVLANDKNNNLIHSPAGTIIECSNDYISVLCGDNTIIKITELQEAGKNKQFTQEFLAGHNIKNLTFSNTN